VAAHGASAVASLAELDWSPVTAAVVAVRFTSQVAEMIAALPSDEPPERPCIVVSTLEPGFAAALDSVDTVFRVIECPVSGGPTGAAAGQLLGLASGERSADADAIIDAMCETVIEFDAYGQPTLAKLINNLCMAYNTVVAVEMLSIGELLASICTSSTAFC
jgi:3-hydroxyisobutyrate dehydrogenase-like beta-hydroxyacid dehydrogenase